MTQTRTPVRTAGTRRPPDLQPPGSIRLTRRGAVVVLFGACLSGLLIAAWTGWSALADMIFVIACCVVASYTRVAGLRMVVACPPLAFCAGCVFAQMLTASDGFSLVEGILVTLGTSAPWLFTGTILTVAIAFGRGFRLQMPSMMRRQMPSMMRRR